MSKAVIDRQRSLECTPVRRRSGTSPEGELLRHFICLFCVVVVVCMELSSVQCMYSMLISTVLF